MNLFNTFLPAVCVVIYFLFILFIPLVSSLISGIISIYIFHNKKTKTDFNKRLGLSKNQFIKSLSLFFTFVFVFFHLYLFTILSSNWIKATPSSNFIREIDQADAIVVYGFGLGKDEADNSLPGLSNIELHHWINTNISEKVIVGQFGNMLAYKANPYTNSFVLMHKHDPNDYVNTYEAALFTFNKLDSLYKAEQINRKVVILAHDMQLQRAVWILKKLSKSNSDWKKYEFIVPELPKISFSRTSVQAHTKYRIIYNLVELVCSRPRDYICN